MSIFKRGDIYWVSFTAPNGERVRRSAQTKIRREAQEFHDRLKSDYWRKHKLGEKVRRSWQEAVVRWLTERDAKVDLPKDKAKLVWLDAFLGGLYLDQIGLELISDISAAKKAEASISTVNRYLALVRSILIAARDDWGWIDKTPRIRLFPEPKKRVRFITESEADRLLKELPAHLSIMAAFTLSTGLRQSNVSYLRWDQVDMQRGVAWIHAEQSKSGKAISIPLNADAMSLLTSLRGVHPLFVFTYRGKPVARTSTKAWYAALERAGIEKFRWHDLRHTWASWHVQRGTSLQELKELGGWSSFEMVLRYAHLASDHLKGAAMRLEGTMLTQCGNREGEEAS